MTLIVLLILATVSLSAVFSEKGIFSRAEKAGNRYNEAKAREVLETVLLADGQYEKHSNPKYNQDDFLDELIKSQIEGAEVKGDVAIVGEYAYELDRSVPKIGRYLGLAKDLVFPTVDATVKLADDKKTATITITASEEKNGINKIEIWLLGEKIDEFSYDNVKTEIEVPYTATQNGKYTIKAYGDLMASTTVEVNGILASVKFEPNGNEEWKKGHSTTVTIQETADKVINAKYVWLTSVATPDDSKFPEEQTFKSGDTITGGNETMTGIYYLWTMLETQSGEKAKWRSEGFNFDNEGPNITSFTSTAVNYSSFKLNLTVEDNGSGIAKYEIFVKGVSQGEQTVEGKNITKEITINNATYGENICYVIVTDKLGNSSRTDIVAKTLMDTTPPQITSFTATKSAIDGIELSATAQDTGTGIVKFEFYVDNVLKGTETLTATTSSITKSKTITGLTTGSHSCKIIVYDAKNNSSNKTVAGTTKLYAWNVYKLLGGDTVYEMVTTRTTKTVSGRGNLDGYVTPCYDALTFNSKTGTFTASMDLGNNMHWYEVQYGMSDNPADCYTKDSSGWMKLISGTRTGSVFGDWTAVWTIDRMTVDSRKTPYTRGESTGNQVTSPSRDTYPTDGNDRKVLVCLCWHYIVKDK